MLKPIPRDLHPEVTVSITNQLYWRMRQELSVDCKEIPLLDLMIRKCADAAVNELHSHTMFKRHLPVSMKKRGPNKYQACDCGSGRLFDHFNYCPKCGAKIHWKDSDLFYGY